jgi:peptidoglycan/xylan/chitin deacetylase (PgdA/CDA1 family)
MSKRRQFAELLQESGALERILELRAHTGAPWLSILTYHRFPTAGGVELFDDGVIDTSAQDLERHLICLKRHFTIVGIDELCVFAKGGTLPKNAIAISFDDGYLDNYEQALPILRKHDCRAIFFVATSYVTERRLYWWDRVAYLLKQSSKASLELRYPATFRVELGDRRLAIFKLLRFIKACPAFDLERLLSELAERAGVVWSPELERHAADQLLMTWDHVRELRRAGMDVQSHTRTHRVLQTLSDAELELELGGSRRDLERELGQAPRALAYPIGRPLPESSRARSALSKAGYELGLSNGTGATPTWGRRDPFDVRRLTVARDVSPAFLLGMLAVPPLAPKHPWQQK